jgi:hypothetical protein
MSETFVNVRKPLVMGLGVGTTKKFAKSKEYKGDSPCFYCSVNRHAGCRPRLDGTPCSCQCNKTTHVTKSPIEEAKPSVCN